MVILAQILPFVCENFILKICVCRHIYISVHCLMCQQVSIQMIQWEGRSLSFQTINFKTISNFVGCPIQLCEFIVIMTI